MLDHKWEKERRRIFFSFARRACVVWNFALKRGAALVASDKIKEQIIQINDDWFETSLAQQRRKRQDAELGAGVRMGIGNQIGVDEIRDGQSSDEADGRPVAGSLNIV